LYVLWLLARIIVLTLHCCLVAACSAVLQHIEHVLPMIPGGGSFRDIITEGDGSKEY
jgi:hypothetical protein